MNKNKIIFLTFISNLIFLANSYSATRLNIPEHLETKELNSEQKSKLLNTNYSKTLSVPEQYKGKLKFTEGKEEVHLKDARIYFGAGGRYTFSHNMSLEAEKMPPNPNYFNKKNTFNMDDNFNFFASGGVYWRNGVRIEFEYSQMTLETTDYGKNFKRYDGPDRDGKGIIFNQYLQTSAVYTTWIDREGNPLYTILTNNMVPLAELSIKTYMINFIFEKTNIKSKIRPYIGFGLGLITSNMESLVNEGEDYVFGGQVMVGLSYSIGSGDVLVGYLGYRGIFSDTIEQTFTRITDVAGNEYTDYKRFDGYTYYNPTLFTSKEKYKFQTHNIDLGLKFFF